MATQIKANKTFYPAIDGLRTYAALGILIAHVMINMHESPQSNFFTNNMVGYFGRFVFLFMLVSGFSLCCGYYERIKNGAITPESFYKKRFIRVIPFFALLCGINIILEPTKQVIENAVLNCTGLFGLIPNYKNEVIGVSWFIGVILVFYLLFPFLTVLLNTRKRAIVSFVLSLIFVFVLADFQDISRNQFVYNIPYFLLGGVIFLYKESVEVFVSKRTKCVSVLTLVSTAIFFKFYYYADSFVANYLCDLVMSTIWLCYAIGTKDYIMNNPVTRYLSSISMETYLCHMLIFRVLEKLHFEQYINDNDLLFTILCVFTFIGSVVFSHMVKFKLFKNRFINI